MIRERPPLPNHWSPLLLFLLLFPGREKEEEKAEEAGSQGHSSPPLSSPQLHFLSSPLFHLQPRKWETQRL